MQVNALEDKALKSTERPITLIPLKRYKGNIALKSVAPNLNYLGVMLPYTGILQLLAEELDFTIEAMSGNVHGSPIISNNDEAGNKLTAIADLIVTHDLEIQHPQDDSVVKFSRSKGQKVLFRRARGYAPNYFGLQLRTDKKIMAMGGHLKSTIAFVPNGYVYLSQYLGNLDSLDVHDRFVAARSLGSGLASKGAVFQPYHILVWDHLVVPLFQEGVLGFQGFKYIPFFTIFAGRKQPDKRCKAAKGNKF